MEAPPPWLQPPPTLTDPPRLADGDFKEKESFSTFIQAERTGFAVGILTHNRAVIKVFLYTILILLFLNHIFLHKIMINFIYYSLYLMPII
jgi:hypothetical protein